MFHKLMGNSKIVARGLRAPKMLGGEIAGTEIPPTMNYVVNAKNFCFL